MKTIAIVTGADSGIGFEVTKALAAKGYKVVMACVDDAAAQKAAADILKIHPQAELDLMHLDLADFAAIEHFTNEFNDKYPHLDLLINNAGVLNVPNGKTKDGLERIIGINFFGPFALTARLLPSLQKAEGQPRIVTVGSDRHRYGNIDFNRFHGEKPYKTAKQMVLTYAASKLADVMIAFKMDRVFKENNINVLSVAVNPGLCATNNARSINQVSFNKFFKFAVGLSNHTIAITAARGAQAVMRAVTQPDLAGGEYITPYSKIFQEKRGPIVVRQASAAAYDDAVASRLWAEAEELSGVKFSCSHTARRRGIQ